LDFISAFTIFTDKAWALDWFDKYITIL